VLAAVLKKTAYDRADRAIVEVDAASAGCIE